MKSRAKCNIIIFIEERKLKINCAYARKNKDKMLQAFKEKYESVLKDFEYSFEKYKIEIDCLLRICQHNEE